MIPKVINYCWFGKGELPELNRRCIESWSKLEGYEIIKWDESNSPMHHPLVEMLYSKKQWAFVSDYVRLYALFNNGGVYFDTDIEVVKDFSDLLVEKCFVAEESEGKLNNAVMGAEVGHEFVKDCMDYMEVVFKKGDVLYSPEVVTNVNNNKEYDMKVFSSSYFYPYNPYRKGSLSQLMFSDIKKETYAIHHWSNSWKSSMSFLDYAKRAMIKCNKALGGLNVGR